MDKESWINELAFRLSRNPATAEDTIRKLLRLSLKPLLDSEVHELLTINPMLHQPMRGSNEEDPNEETVSEAGCPSYPCRFRPVR